MPAPTNERHDGKLRTHCTTVGAGGLRVFEHAKNDLLLPPCRAKVCLCETSTCRYERLWPSNSAFEHSHNAEPSQIDSHNWLSSSPIKCTRGADRCRPAGHLTCIGHRIESTIKPRLPIQNRYEHRHFALIAKVALLLCSISPRFED